MSHTGVREHDPWVIRVSDQKLDLEENSTSQVACCRVGFWGLWILGPGQTEHGMYEFMGLMHGDFMVHGGTYLQLWLWMSVWCSQGCCSEGFVLMESLGGGWDAVSVCCMVLAKYSRYWRELGSHPYIQVKQVQFQTSKFR